jgi:NAD(P)-dependent dehydrogenase (short-subunit alcohol dehydrogenase family)
MDLTGTTALVTGANRGIGRALTEALAGRRLELVLAGVRDPDSFEPIENVRPIRMDLSSREAIDECAAAIDEPVDLLINNAGQMTGGLLEEQDMDAVYAMFQVNLVGVAHLTSRLLPGMLERGRGTIVNVASVAGLVAFPGRCAYSASKGGVVQLTRSLAADYAARGIRANAICPGMVDTPMTRWRLEDPELRGAVLERIPAGRVATTEEVAEAVALLSGDAMPYMNGAMLVLDGGWTAV